MSTFTALNLKVVDFIFIRDLQLIICTTKKNLKSVARISLYNRLKTLADSEEINRSSYNFLEDVSYMTIFNFREKQFVLNDTSLIVQKTFLDHKKCETSLILCFNNIFITRVWNLIRIDVMLSVLVCFILPYPHQKPVNFRKL